MSDIRMKKYPLAKQGVFRTIQGEGVLIGTPMIFIRLAGCSVGCAECDTDYSLNEKLATGELIQRVENVTRHNGEWVWITGGEPSDYDLDELCYYLKKLGHNVAVATSGSHTLPRHNIDWVSVTPHSTTTEQNSGHELKFCFGLNGFSPADGETYIKSGPMMFPYLFVCPLWNDPHSLQLCLEWMDKHPGWRLNIQGHKYWNLP